MNKDFAAAMRRAALATRACDLAGATRVIQDALASRNTSGLSEHAASDITPPPPNRRPSLRLIAPGAETVEPSSRPELTRPVRPRRPLGVVIQALREGRLAIGAPSALTGMSLPGMKRSAPPPIPDGAQYLVRSFACQAGTRGYKLYIPASAPDRPRGLVVMLHGCKQDPDDFATGTNMNAVAETHGLLVAYPGQAGSANASACWNWFNPADQLRDAGEPSIIAGITREIMSEFGLDRSRVFVAGLSAGGAMAAVMGETYPDLYAAVGIHSGLAYGSANDVMSAFAAMRGDAGPGLRSGARTTGGSQPIRTIVFQGTADRTVHPSNAGRIFAASVAHVGSQNSRRHEGRSPGGRAYTRTVVAGLDGIPAVESWLVGGAGHAWSGGHPGGSYTDPIGPNASAEMVRFFLGEPTTATFD
jgi:poly(hydroxyalkanoate) depolymerase family esterase